MQIRAVKPPYRSLALTFGEGPQAVRAIAGAKPLFTSVLPECKRGGEENRYSLAQRLPVIHRVLTRTLRSVLRAYSSMFHGRRVELPAPAKPPAKLTAHLSIHPNGKDGNLGVSDSTRRQGGGAK